MTEYNGQTITYDKISNPLTYRDGMTMTWKRGRQLTALQTEGNSIQYKYYSDSIRTSKIVNGVVHTYEYLNGLLMHETRGKQAYDYYYDANGQLYAVSYKLSESDTKKVYYFTHNWRGDIVGIYNGNGDLKATYEYDAWSNVLSIEDANGNAITSATHIANLNPFRYRGYYMDTETGLYYLMSRYYDSVTHRFVNADKVIAGVGSVQGYNLFSYCMNNPINVLDFSGEWPQWLINATKAIKNAVEKVTTIIANIVKTISNSLPSKGKPGTSQTLPNPDGTPKQKRWYDSDGNAIRDRDYNHSGDFDFPHDHVWENGERGKEHLPPSPEYEFNLEPVAGIAIVTACVLGMVVVAADDITGIGVMDNWLFALFSAGAGEGLIMIFG